MVRYLSLLFVFALVFGCLFFQSCTESYLNYSDLCKNPFSAVIFGEWNGEKIKAKVVFSPASYNSAERDFYAEFLSGSLRGIILKSSGGEIKITMGGMKDIDFEENQGGLYTFARLLSPQEIVSQKSFSEGGVSYLSLQAITDDISYSIVLDTSAVPLRISSPDGFFSLSVSDFSFN